jgi:hypothetical protein
MDSVWPTRVQFAIEVAGDHIITAADPLPTTSVQLSRRSTASGAVRTSLIKVGPARYDCPRDQTGVLAEARAVQDP